MHPTKTRGPRRFTYTWRQIAALAGCSEKTAQNYAAKGDFDPKDVASVLEWVTARKQKRG